ncbi:hypothetical protein BXZ70DRAFT_1009849 [Cristinia sonorae]|uniref:SWR1-complex protein 4 n=1 Tax=Cristinia sonorae TaxID=1940300 RepID=A0A8K0XNP8_9AGAR|nr:hypothetical protein BXZ70DRAFT_1009849 [Cristinia sonorae]
MAGPSAADVRSILSLGPSTPSQTQTPLTRKPSMRKPEGMTRELYALLGPSTPTLATQFAKPRLKQKPKLGSNGVDKDAQEAVAGPSSSGGGRVRWEWREFKNGARTDGLKLKHWVNAATDPNAEYPPAKYNIQPNVYVYSLDEYTRWLSVDKEWTKEETDYLFELVREYDGRFYVVGDRYEFPNGPQRSLEDLKDRYYSVCRKLIRNRPWAGDEASKNQLLSSFQFDKEREVTRKKYVASLESRTPEQIAEEEALYIELKRLEQTERRFKKDRDELLRTLYGVESGLPDIISDEDGLNPSAGGGLSISVSGSGLSLDTKKRKKNGGDLETPMSASSASASVIQLGPPGQKKQQPAKNAAFDALQCIVRSEVPANSNKSSHIPVFFRTLKTPIPRSAVASKVAQLMGELQICHTRLVMPTRENNAKLESLLEAASSLVETKKLVDKVELDIRVARERLGMVSENGGESGGWEESNVAGRSASAGAEGSGAGGAMDVDEDAEGEQEEGVDASGRGQSVASVRSAGRKKQQARRSMSISSVDTAATGGPHKKRKR